MIPIYAQAKAVVSDPNFADTLNAGHQTSASCSCLPNECVAGIGLSEVSEVHPMNVII
jgi:hypothetical protein